MNPLLLLNIATFIIILTVFDRVNMDWSLAKHVLPGMVLSVPFGLMLHLIYGDGNATLRRSTSRFSIIDGGYVQLLQMIVTPFVLVSVLNSVAKLNGATPLGKVSVLTTDTLLPAALISALVSMLVTYLLGLTVQGLVQGVRETTQSTITQNNYVGRVASLSVSQLVQPFIPKNPFAELTGTKPTSIIGMVIFAAFLGVVTLDLLKDDTVRGKCVLIIAGIAQTWVMKLVRLIICLTPYGMLALMMSVVVVSNVQDIIKLGGFVMASYLDLVAMFGVYAVLLTLSGVNPLHFFRKV